MTIIFHRDDNSFSSRWKCIFSAMRKVFGWLRHNCFLYWFQGGDKPLRALGWKVILERLYVVDK